MKRFIQGESRTQSTLLPELLDDYIDEANPVRVIDVYVDDLDLGELGFSGVAPAATGRPAYHPAVLLKLYIYGYLNRIQSSRRLEKEGQRNVELMWLTGRLMPDFKTIANFRKDNGPAIRSTCRQFVLLCQQLNSLSEAQVAIDGSKFKAVNNRDKNFTRQIARRWQIEASISRYPALDTADRQEPTEAQAKMERLQDKFGPERTAGGTQKSRSSRKPHRQADLADRSGCPFDEPQRHGHCGLQRPNRRGYEHHLIVAHGVTNVGLDRDQLGNMGKSGQNGNGC